MSSGGRSGPAGEVAVERHARTRDHESSWAHEDAPHALQDGPTSHLAPSRWHPRDQGARLHHSRRRGRLRARHRGLLERDRVHQLLLDARPELADRIEVDDANPLLTIPTGRGGAIVLWKGEHEGIIRWRMAAPEGESMTVLEPDSIQEFPRLVSETLNGYA